MGDYGEGSGELYGEVTATTSALVEEEEEGMSTLMIAGIVFLVGSTVLLVGSSVYLFWDRRRRKKWQERAENSKPYATYSEGLITNSLA